jgi:hypothetical protein
MKLTNHKGLRASGMIGLLLIELCLMVLGSVAHSQTFSTTTVEGTVYLANGQPGTGTLVVSWPSFTTASGQMVTADSMTAAIAPDGFVSVNLAANQGSTPAGLYYTAIFYLSDGSVNTQYWVVPTGISATLGQVQARLMPATQAIQAASKTYVDQAITALAGSALTASGGTLIGPLTLCCDPATPFQAADKSYVDAAFAQAVPLTGGTLTGPLTSVKLGAVYQVDQFAGADFGAQLGACLSGLNSTNGGTCDARNFTGTLAMGSSLIISTANATVLLPCATISTANQLVVTAGTRNVTLRGCALRGASTASGSQGGTVFYYSGTGAMVQVGDPTYAADTLGFHLDNAVINLTAATSASAQGFAAYRTQELDLENLYFLGNSNQTAMTLDGTGNYTGGTFYDNEFTGFQTAVNAIGHQITNPATTDWVNASTFVRLHIDCPTSGGSPISGTYGINLQQGDGNTFTGGDVEGCSTAVHLGVNAQNNTIIGLRNENSTNQVLADAGSSYNDWITGGTIFTGQLTDNGTRNSFQDTFHRSFNGLNGDWYGSQKDATVTNHYRLGIGAGNERGLLNRYQSDYGYRWTMGLSDATTGEQFYQILDELNNVYRVSVGQYNNGQSSTNNQTVINSAGTGAVVLNGSNNAGTGGVVIGSGGANETTVATISNAGNAQFNGSLQVGGSSTLAGTATVKNQADAEIDATLWAGLTAAQNESFIYKNYLGASQWYMENHTTNDWSLTSAVGGLDSFKAYQSTNSGDTYINTSNSTGVVRINNETGSGTQFKVYGGNSSTLYASFTGTTSIQFPGIAASSGHNCLQVDNSGYVTNTGSACGAGGGGGTVNTGSSGQIAYYNGAGTALSGTSTVSVTAGGTGASTATGALANLGGAALAGATFTGPVSAPSANASTPEHISISAPPYNASCNWTSKAVSMTSGVNILTLAGSGQNFTSSMVGQNVVVRFAGTNQTSLQTTVSGYTDSQHLILAAPAVNSTSGTLAWIGTSDDTAAINAAFSAAGSFTSPKTVFWNYTPQGGPLNSDAAAVDFPSNAICRVTGELLVTPGITINGNGAGILQTNDYDGLSLDYTLCETGSLAGACSIGYGIGKNGFHKLTIWGPGWEASTHAGLRLEASNWGTVDNLVVSGFRYGVETGEDQYMTYNNITSELNLIGWYTSTQIGIPFHPTAISGNGTTMTVTAASNMQASNPYVTAVGIQGCTSTAGLQLNGGLYPLISSTSTNFTFASAVSGSASDANCIIYSIPEAGLTPTDNHYSNIILDGNAAYGLWCQTCAYAQFDKMDSSYNGEADYVIGQQLRPYLYFASNTASGGTCTANLNGTTSGGAITFSGGSPLFAAQGYITTDSSGHATGAYMVTGGADYTSVPAMTIAACSVAPTLPALAIQNDSSYGAYYGANGNQTTNRGGLRFNTAKSESGDGPPIATVNGYPNNGFMVYIDGGVNASMNDIVFNNFIDIGGPYRQRIAWVNGVSRGVVFNNPANPGGPFDTSVNPGQSAFTDYSQIVSNVGTSLKVVWGPGGVTRSDAYGLTVGVNGLVPQYSPALMDAHTVNGEREANGYASVQYQYSIASNNAYRARLWGDTFDRWIVDSFGNMRWGTGSSTQDVGACRSSAGVLSVSDGSTTCDANGGLAAASLKINGGTPITSASSANSQVVTCPAGGTSTQYCGADGAWHTLSSGGTVTSVTFTGDGVLDSSTPGTAVTTSGTVTATIKTQSANTVLAGPATGSAVAPTFRTLVNADIPTTLTGITINGVTPAALSYVDATSSIQTQLGTKATCIAGTIGSDCLTLSSGLVPAANLPTGTSSTQGAVKLGATGGADVYGAAAAITLSSLGAGTAATHASTDFDAAGAAAARQANLSLIAGTYANGDMCTYTASGTLLNCNTAIPTSFPGFGTTSGTAAQGNDSRIVNAAQCTAGTTGSDCLQLSSGAIPNGMMATTQTTGDNSTKLATTAYVSSQITAGGSTLSTANTLTGLPTGCTQYPCVVAKVAPTTAALTSGVSPTVIYAVPSGGAGFYRECGYTDITVASAQSATVYPSAYWTTDGNSQNANLINNSGGYSNSNTQWSNTGGCMRFYADASSSIYYQVGYTTTITPAATVRYAFTLERLE